MAAVTLAAVGLGACSAGGSLTIEANGGEFDGSVTQAPSAATFQAVPAALADTSARFEVTTSVSMVGMNMSMPLSGALDGSSSEMVMNFADMDFSGGDAFGEGLDEEFDEMASMRMEARIVPPSMYLRLSGLPGGSAPWGDSWLEANLDDLGVDASAFTSLSGTGDPMAMVDLLQGVGSFEELGSEAVRGVATTHYQVTIDLGAAWASMDDEARESASSLFGSTGVSGLGEFDPTALEGIEIPFELWLDSDNLPRRVRYAMDGDTMLSMAMAAEDALDFDGSESGEFGETFDAEMIEGMFAEMFAGFEMSMVMEIFDYGDPSISIEAPADTVDLFGQLKSLSGFGFEIDGLLD